MTSLLRWLHALDAQPFRALVAQLLLRWPAERSHPLLQAIFADLESYVVRRRLCGLLPHDRAAVRQLVRVAQAPHLEWHAVKDTLLAYTGDGRWPTDEEFSQACATAPLAAQLPASALLLVLAALNNYLERKETRLLPPALVEYVYPLRPTAGAWPPVATPAEATMVQRLGNLALVVRPLSLAVRNGPFAQKRRALARQGPLLNFDFYDYADEHPWGAADIGQRSRQLARLAVRAWPRG